MSDESNPIKVIFAPGCFDHLDLADQAEVDQLTQELTQMFATITPEELASMTVQLSEEEFADLMADLAEEDAAEALAAQEQNLMQFPAPATLQ
jgi:DNA polymerase III gamma/tau subunit